MEKLIKELIDNAVKTFWCSEKDMLLEMYPIKAGVEKYSFLWGYGAYLTMLSEYVACGGMDKLPELLHSLERLEEFKTDRTGFYYYNSHPKDFGGAEPYYDDNAWVILALLKSYKITKNRGYLLRAQAAAEYLEYGTHTDLGGVYWREYNCGSLNTCSCGPAIMCWIELYEQTKIRKYLDRALRIYGFTVKYLMDSDGTFFDSLNVNSLKPDKAKYTYNTGTMIFNGAALYKLTGEEKYLASARLSAKGAIEHFYKADEKTGGIPCLPSTPWFHVYLLRGLTRLAEITNDYQYVQKVKQSLIYALENARTDAGFVCADWSGKNNPSPYYHQGLDHFGTVECLILLHQALKEKCND